MPFHDLVGFLSACIGWTVVVAITNGMYLQRARETPYIGKRAPEIAVLTSFALLVLSYYSFYDHSSTPPRPCLIEFLIVYYAMPLLFFSLALRCIAIAIVFWTNKAECSKEFLRTGTMRCETANGCAVKATKIGFKKAGYKIFDFFQFNWLRPRHRTYQVDERGEMFVREDRKALGQNGGMRRAFGIFVFCFLLSTAMAGFTFVFSDFSKDPLFVTDKCPVWLFYPLDAIYAVAAILLPITVWSVGTTKDNLNLRPELYLIWITTVGMATLHLILGPGSFGKFGASFVMQIFTIVLPYAWSYRLEKQRKNLDESSFESFRRKLRNDKFFDKVLIALAGEMSVENGLFIKDYEKVKRLLGSNTHQLKEKFNIGKAHAVDAASGSGTSWRIRLHNGQLSREECFMFLVNTYIRPGATHQVKINTRTQQILVSVFDSGVRDIQIFEDAVNEVMHLMYQMTWAKIKEKQSDASFSQSQSHGQSAVSVSSGPMSSKNFQSSGFGV